LLRDDCSKKAAAMIAAAKVRLARPCCGDAKERRWFTSMKSLAMMEWASGRGVYQF